MSLREFPLLQLLQQFFGVVFVIWKEKKVKWSRYMPGLAQRVGRGIALLFHNRGTRRGWVVSNTPAALYSRGRPGTHCTYKRLSGPQGRSGRAENLVPTGIRSRTGQPVVSRYTDWTIRPTVIWKVEGNNFWGRNVSVINSLTCLSRDI
jgi:hypothetical protein